jgi:hypothetical protein
MTRGLVFPLHPLRPHDARTRARAEHIQVGRPLEVPFDALKSGGLGRVQCDSHGTFDTRGTVRARGSRSIKPAQGPAADRAAGQQGVCRTTHAQQSTRGICPHSHWEESSRQQVDWHAPQPSRTAAEHDLLAVGNKRIGPGWRDRMRFDQLKRREFVTVLCGVAVCGAGAAGAWSDHPARTGRVAARRKEAS